MAAGNSSLPDVAKCLSGDEVVVGWNDVLDAFWTHSAPPTTIYRHFVDSHRRILGQTIPHFNEPNATSKSAADKALAPINFPSEPQQKDAEQIKADAQWLSASQKLDEVEALRIALLEWQNRPEIRLNTGLADAELASLRDALGAEYAQTLDLTPGGRYSRADDMFDTDDARKARILRVYHQSHSAMLAVARESCQASIWKPLESRTDANAEWRRFISTDVDPSLTESVEATIQAIDTTLHQVSQQQAWDGIDPALHDQLRIDFTTAQLQDIALLLEILLLRARSAKGITTSDVLQTWLNFISRHQFFSEAESDILTQQSAIQRIQSTTTFITIAILDPAYALDTVENHSSGQFSQFERTPYFLEVDHIEDLHRTLMQFAPSPNPCAGPAVLAWALILSQIRMLGLELKDTRENRYTQRAFDRDGSGRRTSSSSAGSVGDSIFEQVSAQIRSESGINDPLLYMIESAVRGCNVFAYLGVMASNAKASSSVLQSIELSILQDLLGVARTPLGYTPDLLNTQLAVLSPIQTDPAEDVPFKPLLNFVGNSFLMDTFLDVAASRFPYESLPFLRIAKSLAKGGYDALFRDDGVHFITHYFQNLESFSQLAVGGFEAYQTTQEDKNENLVILDRAVEILGHRPHRLLTASSAKALAHVVPEGTIGEVISESMPPVIRWNYRYSGLSLLGRWLELHVKGELSTALSSFENADDVVAAIVGLVGTLLATTHTHAARNGTSEDAHSLCQDLVDEASAELEVDRDIIDCVFDIIEQQLVSTRRFSPAAGCDLLTTCVEFITVLCKIQPLRIWPALVKSSLFSAYGAKRTIFSVISTVEVPLQSFNFLESCSVLLQALMDLVLTVSSRSNLVKGLKSRTTLFQRPLAATVLGLVETMYAAFEAIPSWVFSDLQQKQKVLNNLCTGFSSLLYYSFGTGSAFNVDHGITVSFRAAADFLLNALSGTGVQSLGSGPIALNLVTSALSHESNIFVPEAGSHLISIVGLARTHLGCSRLSGHALKEVNTTLINLFPILIRLPLLYSPVLRPTLALECDIYDAFAKGSRPHLLGHLGSSSCLSFLDSLKYLNARAAEEAHLAWRLISRLITPDQQWTAIVLITGSPPGKKDAVKVATRGKPLLEQSIDKLVKIHDLHATVAVALLKLLQEAQQGWPSVTDTIRSRTDLFPALINFVSSRQAYHNNDLNQAHHNQVAAAVTDLSVITLHSMMVLRDETRFTPFIPLLKWLTKNALDVAAYNTSLHSNLRKNFAMKYDGLDVDVVKRTGILRMPFSDNYFYDLEFAGKILSHDRYWNNGPQGFHAEFRLANINLSVVESELTLLRSFKYLCSEHGSFFARNSDVRLLMSHIVTNSLRANTQQIPPEKLFDTLFQSRAEIAGMLLGPLVTVGAHGSDFTSILRIAYDCIRYRNGSYQLAITNDDLTYWRSMLNVLRLALQFHVKKPLKTQAISGTKTALESIDPSNTLIVDIGAQIIGSGLASVVAAIQDQYQNRSAGDINTTDVALLLNILQTILRLPSLPQFATQLAEALISTDTAQSAMLLYSWSHILLEENTPIYASLSIQLLTTLSQLPLMAEHLAVEGILSRLLSSKLTQRIQSLPQGAGHLDRRPNANIYYTIWSDNFLRITLNLLDSIGGGVAGEVSAFLNAFPQQLRRASLSFSFNTSRDEGVNGITLPAAQELANLSLLSFILERFRLAGASSAVDPSQILSLEGFDEHRKAIAADLGDLLNQGLEYRLRREVSTNEVEGIWAKKSVGEKVVVTEKDAQGKEVSREKARQSVLDVKICAQCRDARRCLLVAVGEEGEDDHEMS